MREGICWFPRTDRCAQQISEYVLSDEQTIHVSEDKLVNDIHKVRDIIINHIVEKYYAKILDINDPREILSKLKEYKRLETRVMSVSARKDLYEI